MYILACLIGRIGWYSSVHCINIYRYIKYIILTVKNIIQTICHILNVTFPSCRKSSAVALRRSREIVTWSPSRAARNILCFRLYMNESILTN